MAKTVKVQLTIENSEGIEVALLENLDIEWCDRNGGEWRVSQTSKEIPFRVGFGDSQKEAILEYLKTRLGKGYSYQQLQRYESGEISLDALAGDLMVQAETIQKVLAE